MLIEFYKIGEVISVHGKKIKIHVFENKNSTILIHKGKIVKNVSVGSYVKIPKGFSNVICRIEGEYIEKYENLSDFTKENESIKRIIEVSILGVLENNKFKRGLIEIPLIFSDVYIIENEEIKEIFKMSEKPEKSICIGTLHDYKSQKFCVDISLFASHIGIFGNTGSGKSNTLAKIYTECFEKYKTNANFKKSSFIIIDFNGEYKSSFVEEKKVLNLSTRKNNADKISIEDSFLEDIDVWSIICEATEKTQRPFLNRAIRLYKFQKKEDMHSDEYISTLKKTFTKLINGYFEKPNLITPHNRLIKKIVELMFKSTEEFQEMLDTLYIHAANGKMTIVIENGNNKQYCDKFEDFENKITNPLIEKLFTDGNIIKCDNYSLFEYSMLYNYINELQRQSINEEHIAPFIRRFENRLISIKNIFKIADIEESNIEIYNLEDVNIEFKKIIPLIICKHKYEKHKLKEKKGSLHLIIDEAHTILSETSERESATWKDYRLETFEEIIKEGRKFGVFLTIASQRPSDISETIISQLHHYFIHRLVNNEDLRAINKAVSFIDNTSYEMIPILPQGVCIFTGVSANFPVLTQIDILNSQLQPQSNTIDLSELWK
ncbi:hypothetical protein MmiHf6_03500 [Methanimicrococcus hongohii]|uniref:Helicase HerA central domain-containing protein n=1 Tax=Methanimicrococcus hongohii TaxID=3028295 RepID=A0AA96UZN8_9EURY|nr:ATP-binding protein [Methanimicrococcus sp. Hf6]WNY23053.1 hypothetical protein MmiHf6_03500 [Methanimicrococcus sp. Hf6]